MVLASFFSRLLFGNRRLFCVAIFVFIAVLRVTVFRDRSKEGIERPIQFTLRGILLFTAGIGLAIGIIGFPVALGELFRIDDAEFYVLFEPRFVFVGESLILALVGWGFGFFVGGRVSGWKWAAVATSIPVIHLFAELALMIFIAFNM